MSKPVMVPRNVNENEIRNAWNDSLYGTDAVVGRSQVLYNNSAHRSAAKLETQIS